MSSLAIEKRSAYELKKHVNLIHCSNNLTLIQRKLFNALLFNAYKDLNTNSEFFISSKKLCELIGYKSNNTKVLKKAILDLLSITIEWNVINTKKSPSGEQWKASSILASASLSGGVCTYEYSSVMRELFFQPEIYGRIDMALLPKFKSSYGLALYENCIRYTGLSQTPWLPIEVFRKLMGIKKSEYSIFTDFKRRILNVAVKEVNLNSPITITPEINRIGRKVSSIRFLLEQKRKQLSNEPEPSNKSSLDEKLRNNFKFSEKSIKNIKSKYDESYICKMVEDILVSGKYINGEIKNPAAFLSKALENNYVFGTKQPNKNERSMPSLSKFEIQERMNKKYSDYIYNQTKIYISMLKTEELDSLKEAFEKVIIKESQPIFNFYKKGGFEHAAVKSMFNIFVREKHIDKMDSLLSQEEFEKECPSFETLND
jgi:plasmid replication initiation protein